MKRTKDRGTRAVNPTDHLGLAYLAAAWAARRYGGVRDEWLGSAYAAMHEACACFDPGRGSTFSAYAKRWMQGRLSAEFRRRRGDQLRCANGERRWVRSVCEPLDPDIPSRNGAGAAEDPEVCGPGPLTAIDRGRRPLTPIEENAVRLRLRGCTLRVIGDELGVSRERARQILVGVRADAG